MTEAPLAHVEQAREREHCEVWAYAHHEDTHDELTDALLAERAELRAALARVEALLVSDDECRVKSVSAYDIRRALRGGP